MAFLADSKSSFRLLMYVAVILIPAICISASVVPRPNIPSMAIRAPSNAAANANAEVKNHQAIAEVEVVMRKMQEAYDRAKQQLEENERQWKRTHEETHMSKKKIKEELARLEVEHKKLMKDLEEMRSVRAQILKGIEEIGTFFESPRMIVALQRSADLALSYGSDIQSQIRSMVELGVDKYMDKKHAPFLVKIISWLVMLAPIFMALWLLRKIGNFFSSKQLLLTSYSVQLSLLLAEVVSYCLVFRDPVAVLNESSETISLTSIAAQISPFDSSQMELHHSFEINLLLLFIFFVCPVTCLLLISCLAKSSDSFEAASYMVQLIGYVLWCVLVRRYIWIPLMRNHPFVGLPLWAYSCSAAFLILVIYLTIRANPDTAEYEPVTMEVASALNRVEHMVGSSVAGAAMPAGSAPSPPAATAAEDDKTV
eukprot:CAMPEP_0184699500 /NCGR_PEP_ID=MMETSP0313-20130426/5753_1 /TAXON_ID=2792 /ORGANISM="Porphyridium aerugineum, Strain SAG 1380-2" /LENGTH=425 /DNA_ID=CAMNT_0027158607 /DNA_START=124 /DNA_END=1401 /DNA_ORIENTATION=-